ncbi:T9SS type B sorting domain-containing protein [Gaetbulibacter jejuensis]|uniref:Ig-like domain-containing protein n=1 Tax=Gaetbulibacter jejuensis TaxID=584607 RepID=A0ABN1JKH7_9FLAO
MFKNYLFSILIVLSVNQLINAQLCEGNLGDPVVSIDFGSGQGRGDALGNSVTAFTYVASGELDEGEYTIHNTTSGLKGNAWHVTTDHTGNTNGYMMIINSAVLASEGVFYTKTVSGLCADTTYEFSAWLMNIMNPSIGTDQYHPDVTFRISDTSGNVLGTYNTGDIAQSSSGVWIQYGFFFTLEADTEVVITILNSAPSAHPGNDIALDDISFRPCGPDIITSIDGSLSNSLSVCQDEIVSYNLEANVSSGYDNPQYQWQFSNDFGINWTDISGETYTNYTYTDTSTPGIFLYRLTAANGSNINTENCRIVSDEFYIEIIETPEALNGETEQVFCITQNATINDIEVSDSAIWYSEASGGNPLPETTLLINGSTYYASKLSYTGCESDERFSVTIEIVFPTLMLNNVTDIVCDTNNDNIEEIDLTLYESEITNCNDCIFSYFLTHSDAENFDEDGYIANPDIYEYTLDQHIIYVRVDSSDNCYQIAEISLEFGETPIIPIEDILSICENEAYITINAGEGFNSYLWSNGETTQSISLTYDDIGSYWVTVEKDYGSYICNSTKEFEVLPSNAAIITSIEIQDWTSNNNTITVILSDTSIGDYEYSLDNINFQDNNVFTNLTPGEYIVYVRDKYGCGLTMEEAYIINYPKFFTPNNDGINDYWYINNYYIEPSMTIKIFDRYGKFLKHLNATSRWDGTYNGKLMPTNDYWFVVTRENGKTYKGHFTLKR